MTASKRWGFMRSRLVALAATTCLLPAMAGAQVVEYYHLDALGSVRAITNQSGAVVERHDYLPFGEEWNPPPPRPDNQPVRFTGKERDGETGFDYFGARYYGSKIGRFTTVDPALDIRVSLNRPQRWNRYAYASNNPLSRRDRDGREDFKEEWLAERVRIISIQGYQPLTAKQREDLGAIENAIFIPLLILAAPAVIEAGGALWVEGRIAAGVCGASPACQNGLREALEGIGGVPSGAAGRIPGFTLALGRFGADKPGLDSMARRLGAHVIDEALPGGAELAKSLRAQIDAADHIFFRLKNVVPGTVSYDVELTYIVKNEDLLAKTTFIRE